MSDRKKRTNVFLLGLCLMLLSLIITVIHAINTVPYSQIEVKITSLTQKCEQSEGDEVTIMSVIIDGREYSADQIFEGWVENENGEVFCDGGGNLSTTGIIPSGHSRKVLFASNRWKGMASISVNQNVKKIDLYSEEDSGIYVFDVGQSELDLNKSYFMTIVLFAIKVLITLSMLWLVACIIVEFEVKKVEEKIVLFLEKRLDLIFILFVSCLACFVRIKLLHYETGDFINFLNPWYEYLKSNGRFLALKDEIGNYTEGYMLFLTLLTYIPINVLYGIKIFSIVFEFGTAILARKIILDNYESENKVLVSNIVYTLLLFAPTIIFNSAYWGQCDSIYAFFIICSLYCYSHGKWNLTFVSMGCGLAFKPQTVLILPIYLILYLKDKKFSILKFVWIPLTYIVWSLPALFEGKAIRSVFLPLLSYGDGTTSELTFSFNNLYTLVQTDSTDIKGCIRVIGVSVTLALVASSMILFAKAKYELTSYKIVSLALYFILLITYFLPGMHERYLYVGDVLCIVWWALSKRKQLWYIPTGILMFSLLNYLRYVTNVWPGSEWNIITEINGLVCVVYVFFLVKTLIILGTEVIGENILSNKSAK